MLIDLEKVRYALMPGAKEKDLDRLYRHCPKAGPNPNGLTEDDWAHLMNAYQNVETP